MDKHAYIINSNAYVIRDRDITLKY